jgi:hypothetical protein
MMADGFAANEQGLRGLVAFSRDRAEELRGVVGGLHRLPTPNRDACGDAGALEAYQNFFGAWTDELGITVGGLDEVGQKFTDTANTYMTIDVYWLHDFQAIDPE